MIISAKKSRHWNAGGNALNVETAGYALLTQMILGRNGYAGPIVTYMTNQRQGGVGFVSTQVCHQFLFKIISHRPLSRQFYIEQVKTIH